VYEGAGGRLGVARYERVEKRGGDEEGGLGGSSLPEVERVVKTGSVLSEEFEGGGDIECGSCEREEGIMGISEGERVKG
jgi:hypothetical protein